MKLYRIIFLLAVFSLLPSCGDNLSDLNIDPNTSPTAPASAVLTAGMGYYGIALDAYINEADAIMAQYWAGGPGVNVLDIERYAIEPGDFNAEWAFSYRQALTDLRFVIRNGHTAQAIAGEIMSIAIYQNMVDHYGDIPYSDALNGSQEDGSVLTPTFDTAESVYDDLVTRLDAVMIAIETNEELLGDEDLVYGGDLTLWHKFANSLKLRILMRKSTVDESDADAVRELIAEDNFISSAAEIAQIAFLGDAGNWNPQFARREQGIGQFYVASNSIVSIMDELADPRLTVMFDPAVNTGEVEGMIQGNVNDLLSPSKDDFSFPTSVSYDATNDVILLSHWEVSFLRAEAAARYGTADDDKAMFDQAIAQHFDYVGADGVSDYLAGSANYDPGASLESKLSLIGVQKWLSMNGLQESEGWIESRRFDLPGARIFTDPGTGIFTTPTRTVLGDGIFPSIRLYPQSEVDFNPNTPARSLTDNVFWDN